MSLTWTPVESGTPTWTPAEDDDLTFTKRGFLSSDAVKVGDETLTDVLDGLPTLPIDAEDVSVDVSGTPTPLDDVLTGIGGSLVTAGTILTQHGASIEANSEAISALEAAPRAATDLWLATAADNPGPGIYDHGDRRAHGIFTQGIDTTSSATDVIQLPAGTWSVHPSYDEFDRSRPRIPDRSGLAFADGMRIMWRARLGLIDGWEGHDGIGYADVLCHQSIGSDGFLDSFEPGLRYELTDPPQIRVFVDNTPAGSTDLAGDEHQDYSDPLTLAQAIGSDFLIDITFDAGDRIYEFYLPCADGDTPDLTVPGEVVEDWTLHSTATRTAPPGFYVSGLEWRLGDKTNAIAWLKAWDLGTGDLEIDFDGADVATAGWTDSAGNEWDATVARVVEGPCLYVGAGTAYLEPVALNPGDGDWTLAWWAHHTTEIGTDTGEGGWTLTPDPGGATLTLNDGTTSVDLALGITDDALHFVIVSLDRTADLATVTVDGLLVDTADLSGLGDVTGDPGLILPDGHTLRFLSFQRDALSLPELDALHAEVVASFEPPTTGGAGPAGADGASAYEVAVANGFVGDETAWLASLVGAPGATGAKGDKGDTGNTGATGPAGDPTTVADGAIPQAKVSGLVAALAKIGTTVEATSDSPARTSTTATADGTLQFEAAADTTYRVDAYLIFQGDATADLKLGFTTPTSTMHLTVEGALTTVASGSDYDRFLTLTSSGATTVVGIAGASTPISVRISGVIRCSSAGTVALVWAPNGAGAGTGVTRLARSQLYYRAA